MTNDEYARTVLPHLKDEYFSTQEEKAFFKIYARFFQKHNRIPSKQAMLIEIEGLKSAADLYTSMVAMVSRSVEFEESLIYLVEKTEEYCKEKAIFNALKESVLIVDGQSKDKNKDSIPSILQAALSVCFNTSVGHDYLEDFAERYDYYHNTEARIPVNIPIFDKITKNGFPRKTLNVFLAPPHGYKSAVMSNLAAGALMNGYNVLYISLEMAAEEIGRRFDVNLMGVNFDDLDIITKDTYTSKFEKISSSTQGRLVIKEYPTGTAHAGHFRALLSELKTKQNFVPDMIVVDYMSIAASEIYKNGSAHNSYTIVGSIGKELRALAIETNSALITAVQTTRAGAGNSDVDISHTSESFGIPAIADFFAAIINTDELKALKQLMFKQLKNRYTGLDKDEKFILGVDTPKMKLYSLDGEISIPISKKPEKKDKLEKNIVSKDAPFDFDILHTIKPEKASFEDFNFDN